MTVTPPRRTRRTHSEEFKRSLIDACGEPGASVAGVALANGINANQLRRWMRERGIEPPVTDRHNRATSDRHIGASLNRL